MILTTIGLAIVTIFLSLRMFRLERRIDSLRKLASNKVETMGISICVKWQEDGRSVVRRVDNEEEARALATEKNGVIERWPTITSGTVKVYGLGEDEIR